MKSLNKLGREFNKHAGAGSGWRDGLARALEELDEALAAATWEDKVKELADVILTLASLADSYHLDLDSAIEAKHAVNLARKWAPHPTIVGAVKHVKEPAK